VRSVFLFLRDTTEQTVDTLLQQICRRGRGPRWVVTVADEPYLYVDFYVDARREFETDEWIALAEALGGEPAVKLIARSTVSQRMDTRNTAGHCKRFSLGTKKRGTPSLITMGGTENGKNRATPEHRISSARRAFR